MILKRPGRTILALLGLSLSACVDKVECSVHSDCPSGAVCTSDHQCTLGDKLDCKSNADCEGEEVCTLRGCVADPVCTSDEECSGGYHCDRYECQADDANDYLVELDEGGIGRLALPEGATVLQAGESELVRVTATEGGLLFTATSCEQGQDTVYSQLQLADGTPETIATLVRLSDPAPPSAPRLKLVQTEIGAVEARFEVPPENGSGSCPTREFSLSWSGDGSTSNRSVSLEEAEATIGQEIIRSLPVAANSTIEVQLTAKDEAEQSTTTTSTIGTSPLELTEFSVEPAQAAAGAEVSVRYAVENARSVTLLRNGAAITEPGPAAGSWTINAGAFTSELRLRATDAAGLSLLSAARTLQVDSEAEEEPNDSADTAQLAGPVIAGLLTEGDVDVWRLNQPNLGGNLHITPISLQPRPTEDAQITLELLDSAGQLIAHTTTQNLDAWDLPAGSYYLKISAAFPLEYAFAVGSAPARCGNSHVETYAGETCDGGVDCTDQCSLSLSSRVVRFPTTVQVRARELRFPISVQGWVDIGTGDYAMDRCPERATQIRLLQGLNEDVVASTSTGGPGGCARLIQRFNGAVSRKFIVEIKVADSAATEFTLNYAVHDWGSCQDYVLNPLSEEECDIGHENNGRMTCNFDCELTMQDPPYYRTTDADACFPAEFTGPIPEGHNILKISCSQNQRRYNRPVTTEVHVYDADRHYITNQTVLCGDEDSFVALPVDFEGTACIDSNNGASPHPIGQVSTGTQQ